MKFGPVHALPQVRQAEVGKLERVVLGSIAETTGFKPVEAHFQFAVANPTPPTPSPRACRHEA
jgi:hypothetical protein